MEQAAANILTLTKSKAYKSYMKCLAKDATLKPRVEQMNLTIKLVLAEVKVLQKEMAAARQGRTQDYSKIIDLTKQMMEHIIEISEIEAGHDLIDYSFKSCAKELQDVTKLQKDMKIDSLRKLKDRVDTLRKQN
jgi:chromosome segregation ATPase